MSSGVARQLLEALKVEIAGEFSTLSETGIILNHKFIPQEQTKSPEADMYIELPTTIICVELEYQQPHPDTNVLKYLRWISSYDIPKRIVLVQIFGPIFAKGNYISRVRNVHYLVGMTREMIDYFPLFCTTYTPDQYEAQNPQLLQQITDLLYNVIAAYNTGE